MTWSFSISKQFTQCQRQWFYKTKVANGVAKDPLRKEAYLLSKLQSVYSWRGKIVDTVLSDYVVKNLKNGINEKATLVYAKTLFERQLDFAKNHDVRQITTSITKLGDQFAAFFESEYGNGLDDSQIESAWRDVETAIHNFFMFGELIDQLKKTDYLVTQRSLSFEINGFKAKAVPDLIAFQRSGPPIVYDWKVHTFAYQDYRLQLACYAIALTSGKPHKDFPQDPTIYSPTDIKLVEVQLLKNELREYQLTLDDIQDTEEYIENSASEIGMVLGDEKSNSPLDFLSATNPDTCSRCTFRSLCWK